jgi:signal transduction histidine kinase
VTIQLPTEIARQIERSSRLTSAAGYVSLVVGYLMSVLQAHPLTISNFVAFSLVNVLYCAALWLLMRGFQTRHRFGLATYGLLFSGLALAGGFLATSGIEWDWLIYIVTVALFFGLFQIRPALFCSIALYGVMTLNLAVLNRWQWSSQFLANLGTLLAAYAFVGAFSLVSSLHQQQKERAEHLLQTVEQSKRDLEAAHAQLQRSAEQVEELSVARERTRLAREMHDTLGHYLTILNVQLETICKLYAREPARAAVEIVEARRVAAQSMQELRNAVAALRSTSRSAQSLPQMLAQLGQEFQSAAGETELTLDLETELPTLSPDVQVALFRAAQESLTNVRKHAQASKVLVRLRYEEHWLELVVLDNGTGNIPTEAEKQSGGESFGLIGLRERVELLGGQMSAGPATPAGFRVTVRIPGPALPQQRALEDVSGATPVLAGERGSEG